MKNLIIEAYIMSLKESFKYHHSAWITDKGELIDLVDKKIGHQAWLINNKKRFGITKDVRDIFNIALRSGYIKIQVGHGELQVMGTNEYLRKHRKVILNFIDNKVFSGSETTVAVRTLNDEGGFDARMFNLPKQDSALIRMFK